MKITVEFDNWEEMEAFRISGRKTRGKSQSGMTEVEEAVEAQAARADPTVTRPVQIEQTAQAIRDAQPVHTVQSTFTPPQQQGNIHSFPGGNSGTAQVHPLVTAILARIDGAVNGGQPADAVVTWFRQQIGPEAAQATLDQIKQVFIPRMTEQQLKQIAPQLGIQA
jgi:hypothetical protein